LKFENGEERRWNCNLTALPVLQAAAVEGVRFVVKRLALPPGLPWGYHQLTLALPACSRETLVISAPRRVSTLFSAGAGRFWGVFLPLYALTSERSWGAGDFTDLENLCRWTCAQGAAAVGTLPLLAAFLDEPFEPSPYSPASRLFWNEFYLDVARAPELERSPAAQDLLKSPEFRREIEELRAAPLVDYRRGMAVKRRVLEHLARSLFAEDSARQAELRRWAAENPAVQDYARFRAAGDRQRAGWPAWPGRMRDGVLRQGDYDPEAERYHLYVQWLAHEQLRSVAAQARRGGVGLYLDLPVGVHPAGYDTWRERAAFALEAGSGAPPDLFFTGGQNWRTPPLHPERIREQGYRYYIACLRHHLRYAGALRLDHIMGFHRLFWVPRGLAARDGVYVRYRAGEFYAVLALESHRYGVLVVGEDLGTVPYQVREAMSRHGVYRMYVLPFEMSRGAAGGVHEGALRPVPAGALACLNTHDMAPFAAFWRSLKVGERRGLSAFLSRKGRLKYPPDNTAAVLKACLAHLAASPARVLLVNLEDLWLETAPQNTPDAGEYPNWRRKARYTLEEFTQVPEVRGVLQEIDALRRKN
jgi:4-alpha-glucanotransferase